jgi:hypothetical protein
MGEERKREEKKRQAVWSVVSEVYDIDSGDKERTSGKRTETDSRREEGREGP